MSFDDPAKNADWAADEGFQYDLWSDEGRELALYYGAAVSETQGSASRVTKVMDSDGTLVLEYLSVSTGTSPGEVLADVTALFGG